MIRNKNTHRNIQVKSLGENNFSRSREEKSIVEKGLWGKGLVESQEPQGWDVQAERLQGAPVGLGGSRHGLQRR